MPYAGPCSGVKMRPRALNRNLRRGQREVCAEEPLPSTNYPYARVGTCSSVSGLERRVFQPFFDSVLASLRWRYGKLQGRVWPVTRKLLVCLPRPWFPLWKRGGCRLLQNDAIGHSENLTVKQCFKRALVSC